jgi:hypothetical protein
MSSARQEQREELVGSIIAQCRLEIEAVCDEAELSDETRDEIAKNLMANAERILDACTVDELQVQSAFEKYMCTCAQDARLEIRRLQYDSKTTKT